MQTIEELTKAAEATATEIRTVTRADGSTFQGARNYGSADNGVVQVYVVPVDRRTSSRAPHYRATFYVMTAGKWKRASRAAADAAMAAAPAEPAAAGRKLPETLCSDFRVWLAEVGKPTGKTAEEVYALWWEYCQKCGGDQSPVKPEFLEWYAPRLKPAA